MRKRWCLKCSPWASYLLFTVTSFSCWQLETRSPDFCDGRYNKIQADIFCCVSGHLLWKSFLFLHAVIWIHEWPFQGDSFPQNRPSPTVKTEGWKKDTCSPQISSSATFVNWEINSFRDLFQALQIIRLKANGALLLYYKWNCYTLSIYQDFNNTEFCVWALLFFSQLFFQVTKRTAFPTKAVKGT